MFSGLSHFDILFTFEPTRNSLLNRRRQGATFFLDHRLGMPTLTGLGEKANS